MHKFGGASLADSSAVRHALQIVQAHRQDPLVVVVSAMAGVTDAIFTLAHKASSGDEGTVTTLVSQLRSRHEEVARGLVPEGRSQAAALDQVAELFRELEGLLHGLPAQRDVPAQAIDMLVAQGERLSA
ncbi:MAG TPA: hypothetical protein VFZ87_08895, partial [Gemmatimonadales bacterium]